MSGVDLPFLTFLKGAFRSSDSSPPSLCRFCGWPTCTLPLRSSRDTFSASGASGALRSGLFPPPGASGGSGEPGPSSPGRSSADCATSGSTRIPLLGRPFGDFRGSGACGACLPLALPRGIIFGSGASGACLPPALPRGMVCGSEICGTSTAGGLSRGGSWTKSSAEARRRAACNPPNLDHL
jgi:hypothetical protein